METGDLGGQSLDDVQVGRFGQFGEDKESESLSPMAVAKVAGLGDEVCPLYTSRMWPGDSEADEDDQIVDQNQSDTIARTYQGNRIKRDMMITLMTIITIQSMSRQSFDSSLTGPERTNMRPHPKVPDPSVHKYTRTEYIIHNALGDATHPLRIRQSLSS